MTAEASADTRPESEFWQGVRAGFPPLVASAPFGLLFGAVAAENGFTPFEAVVMSATIYGGASQLVGVNLFGAKVAPWLIVFSIFAVNFRHVLYSATIGRHMSRWTSLQRYLGFFFLVDPQFAEAERRGEEGNGLSYVWYMGMALPFYGCWVAEAGLGAMFGRLIPDTHALGMDFLLPLYFLGLVMGFRKRSLWLPVVGASAVASILAHWVIGSPWHVSAGALAGVFIGALLAPGDSAEQSP